MGTKGGGLDLLSEVENPREMFPWEFEQYRCLLLVRGVGQSRGRSGDEVCAGSPLCAVNITFQG